jgi:hypothetical protein
MVSKDVRGSDHEGIISLLESVLSHFPINIPSTECKKMYSVLKTKQKKWNMLAVWKVWRDPSYPKMFQGISHKNITLGNIQYTTLKLKKKSSVVHFL